MRWILAAMLALATPAMAMAVECREVAFEGNKYSLCEVDAAQDDLRLFLTNPETGKPYGGFDNVARHLAKTDEALLFAMNGGMYHSDRRPVGHYVEDGVARAPVISTEGPGNFGLLPNGIFCVQQGGARVVETRRFLRDAPDCTYATQSGPMLVIDGKLHPRFLKDSDSRYIRNGVGVSKGGRKVWFVMSRAAVNFHTFASFFRDGLKVPQALYFDGNISRLYAPGLGRDDGGFPMGPIVGVVGQAK